MLVHLTCSFTYMNADLFFAPSVLLFSEASIVSLTNPLNQTGFFFLAVLGLELRTLHLLVRQELYCLSSSFSPIWSGYFGCRVSFSQAILYYESLIALPL
jgi:hypothetical protein